MLTIPEIVREIVSKTPLLEEGLNAGLLNYSAVARQIKPDVEEILLREVTEGAVLMALKRLGKTHLAESEIKKVFHEVPDMIVRSNLFEITVHNSNSLLQSYIQLLNDIATKRNTFFIITQGVFETTIIASNTLREEILKVLKGRSIVAEFNDLSSITLKLPEIIVETSGVYNYILRVLAWNAVNIIELASTYTEFTIILKTNDVDRAFGVLKKGLKI